MVKFALHFKVKCCSLTRRCLWLLKLPQLLLDGLSFLAVELRRSEGLPDVGLGIAAVLLELPDRCSHLVHFVIQLLDHLPMFPGAIFSVHLGVGAYRFEPLDFHAMNVDETSNLAEPALALLLFDGEKTLDLYDRTS